MNRDQAQLQAVQLKTDPHAQKQMSFFFKRNLEVGILIQKRDVSALLNKSMNLYVLYEMLKT